MQKRIFIAKFLAKPLTTLMFLGLTLIVPSLSAGEADVVGVEIIALGDNKYRINTALKHADTGWDHYADRWDVLAPDGTVLGSRELAHPHVNEQPFTRSLTLTIPAGIATVTIQANDSVHGLGGKTMTVDVNP